MVVGEGILMKFNLIQALMIVLAACKNEEDLSKNEAIDWSQHFTHYKSMGIFFGLSTAANSAVGGLIWQHFEPILDFWLSLLPARMRKIQ